MAAKKKGLRVLSKKDGKAILAAHRKQEEDFRKAFSERHKEGK